MWITGIYRFFAIRRIMHSVFRDACVIAFGC